MSACLAYCRRGSRSQLSYWLLIILRLKNFRKTGLEALLLLFLLKQTCFQIKKIKKNDLVGIIAQHQRRLSYRYWSDVWDVVHVPIIVHIYKSVEVNVHIHLLKSLHHPFSVNQKVLKNVSNNKLLISKNKKIYVTIAFIKLEDSM